MRHASVVLALVGLAVSQDAQAFCTEWWPVVCVDEGHEEATREIDFLRGTVWEEIDDAGWWQDTGDASDDDPLHAQYCQFQEMVDYVNGEYDLALQSLDPAAPDPLASAAAFGRMLHDLQDFYSHSNWVELLEDDYGPWNGITPQNLLDTGTGPFRSLLPQEVVRDDIVVGQLLPDGGMKDGWGVQPLPLDSAVLRIEVDGVPTYRALVTGWGKVDDTELPVCLDGRGDVEVDDAWGFGPRSTRLAHGTNTGDWDPSDCETRPWVPGCEGYPGNDDPCADGYPTSVCLNKDDPGRPHYWEALTLAGYQTQVEWCRLLHRSAASGFGYDASSILMTLWAQPGVSAHPAGTACAPAAPGPVEVTVTVEALTSSVPELVEDPFTFVRPGGQYVAALYTGDFGQSASVQSSRTDTHPTLTLCVDPEDTAFATVWGWDDRLGTSGAFDPADEALLGTTLPITPGQGAGVYRQTTPDLDVTYRVAFDTPSGDEDTLSRCAEAYHHTSDTDPDTDDDGLWDDTEVILGTDPTRWDTDGDHVGDKWEVWDFATDALDPDTDDDCATDGVDIWNLLDPLDPDTDGDVRLDGAELLAGTDPLVADPPQNVSFSCVGFGTDGFDGEPPDGDGDGLDDLFEPAVELDPRAADTDGDGIEDGVDPSWVTGLVAQLGDAATATLVAEAGERAAAGDLTGALDRVVQARAALSTIGSDGQGATHAQVLAAGALDAVVQNLEAAIASGGGADGGGECDSDSDHGSDDDSDHGSDDDSDSDHGSDDDSESDHGSDDHDSDDHDSDDHDSDDHDSDDHDSDDHDSDDHDSDDDSDRPRRGRR